jgi:PAS domain S-box-containing protein
MRSDWSEQIGMAREAGLNEDGSSDDSEARRLAIIAAYTFDRPDISRQLNQLAGLAARVCNAPIGLVSLVEAERQRFIGKSGLDVDETPREIAFCDIARLSDNGMVVPDARDDARFRDNPLVTGEPGIRLYASQPLRSVEGAALGTLCVIDTRPRTDLSQAQLDDLRTLADAAMALLERWRLDKASRARAELSKTALHDLQQRFQVLADAMPQMVWSSLPSGHTDYFSRLWCEYTGAPAEVSYGDGWMQFLHRDDKDVVARTWQQAVADGDVYEIEYRLRGANGDYRWMLARGLPMRDEHGEINRWLGTCTDVHEQKAAAEVHALLTRELSHRIKNIFAVIGGLIMLSLRGRPQFAQIGAELQQRVLALGRAHDFVRPQTQFSHAHSSLYGMLDSLLAPYQTTPGERVSVRGEDVRIDDRSATPLALFFHELATNAAKYGALSTDAGHVDIEVDTADPALVTLNWAERGGPPVRPATTRGFGSSLIEMSVTRQLGGTIEYDWQEAGLRVRACIPLKMMAR